MSVKVIQGDCLEVMKDMASKSINTCITSPPYYGLRDYGVDGQLGLESTPEAYVAKLVTIFQEVKRVLRDDGTLWLNLGDSYCGGKHPIIKPKDLVGIPWMVAFALRADGWYLRSDIIWHKPNPMPESVTDRPTKSHEYLFLLSKQAKYYYDSDAIAELAMPDNSIRDRDATRLNNTPGRTRMGGLKVNNYEYRNKRSVWTISTRPYKEAHFATYPVELITPCILAGCPVDGTVLDPFSGAGTTGVAALANGRNYVGIELNPDYVTISEKRLSDTQPPLELLETF